MVFKPPAHESYFDKLKKRLEALGYPLQGEVKDCTGHGVPQREIAEKNDWRNQTPSLFCNVCGDKHFASMRLVFCRLSRTADQSNACFG